MVEEPSLTDVHKLCTQITRPKVKKDTLKYFPCIPEECSMYPKYLLMSFVLHSLK